jgi:hypothetical protein
VLVADADPQFGVVLAGDGGVLAIGQGLAAAAIAVWLERSGADDIVRVAHGLEPGLRLRVTGEGAARSVGFAGWQPAPGQDFICAPIWPADVPARAQLVGEVVARAVALPARGETMVAALADGWLRPELAEAMLARLPVDELGVFCALLAERQAVFKLLCAGMRRDAWLTERMAGVLAWRRGRGVAGQGGARQGGRRFLPLAETADLPGTETMAEPPPAMGVRLNAAARLATMPRRMACVLGSARNEGPYLLEWIAYYRSIGFDHVFLYTNENDDQSDALLERLASAGVVSWIDQAVGVDVLPQHRAYAHALSVLPEILDYRWTLIADLDEFVGFDTRRFPTMRHYLAWQDRRGADSVTLPWLLYAAGPTECWRDAPCIERFGARRPDPDPRIKSLLRTNRFWTSNCHYPVASLGLPVRVLAQGGSPHLAKMPENNPALSRHPHATHAWMAHYIHKTAPEVLMKMSRGQGDVARARRASRGERYMRDFVELSRQPRVADGRMAACGAGLATEMARLRAIPGVAACEQAIKRVFVGRMEEAWRAFFASEQVGDAAMFREYVLGSGQGWLKAS